MSHRLVATATLAALAALAAATPTAAQRAPRPSRNCVRFVQQPGADGRSIEFTLANRCDVAVEATVTYQVACGESGGGAAAAQERRASLGPREQRVVVASAEACAAAGEWRIHDVRWSWRPSGSPDVASR